MARNDQLFRLLCEIDCDEGNSKLHLVAGTVLRVVRETRSSLSPILREVLQYAHDAQHGPRDAAEHVARRGRIRSCVKDMKSAHRFLKLSPFHQMGWKSLTRTGEGGDGIEADADEDEDSAVAPVAESRVATIDDTPADVNVSGESNHLPSAYEETTPPGMVGRNRHFQHAGEVGQHSVELDGNFGWDECRYDNTVDGIQVFDELVGEGAREMGADFGGDLDLWSSFCELPTVLLSDVENGERSCQVRDTDPMCEFNTAWEVTPHVDFHFPEGIAA